MLWFPTSTSVSAVFWFSPPRSDDDALNVYFPGPIPHSQKFPNRDLQAQLGPATPAAALTTSATGIRQRNSAGADANI
jgi:hypothetical protein